MNFPQDVANEALVACGFNFVIGNLQEGTRPAQILLQKYGQCLRQLLRSAHWNFARLQTPMTLLADATGQTPNVPTNTIAPWVYEYAIPIDCMKARFVPWGPQGLTAPIPSGNYVPPNSSSPVVGGLGVPVAGAHLRPARFLEANDPNFAPQSGQLFWETQGSSPQGQTVILTNVQNATLVYTALMNYPSNWDSQFRAAIVAFLASEVAFALWASKGEKFAPLGMKIREDQMKIAAAKIMAARLTDGNEGWHNSDFVPDWMRFRNSGSSYRGGYSQNFGSLGDGGPGIYFGGMDGCCGVGNTGAY